MSTQSLVPTNIVLSSLVTEQQPNKSVKVLDLLVHRECTAVLLWNLLRLVQKRPLVINVIFISCVTFDPCTHFLYAASVKINWMLYQCGHRYIFFLTKSICIIICALWKGISKNIHILHYTKHIERFTTKVVLSNDYNNPIVLSDDIS